MSLPKDVPIRGVVSDDGTRLSLDGQSKSRLKALAGQHIDIRPVKRTRSLEQNAWVWGVAYLHLADTLGYDRHEIEDLHYGLVAKWGGEHFDKRLGAMVPNKRSSKLTTKEFSDYMEWLVRFAAQECGCVIPLPDEADAA